MLNSVPLHPIVSNLLISNHISFNSIKSYHIIPYQIIFHKQSPIVLHIIVLCFTFVLLGIIEILIVPIVIVANLYVAAMNSIVSHITVTNLFGDAVNSIVLQIVISLIGIYTVASNFTMLHYTIINSITINYVDYDFTTLCHTKTNSKKSHSRVVILPIMHQTVFNFVILILRFQIESYSVIIGLEYFKIVQICSHYSNMILKF